MKKDKTYKYNIELTHMKGNKGLTQGSISFLPQMSFANPISKGEIVCVDSESGTHLLLGLVNKVEHYFSNNSSSTLCIKNSYTPNSYESKLLKKFIETYYTNYKYKK